MGDSRARLLGKHNSSCKSREQGYLFDGYLIISNPNSSKS